MESTTHRGGERSPGDLFARARREADEDARWELVSALHALPSREVLEGALALCESPAASDRCLAADVLGQLGTPLMPWRDRSAGPLRALLSDRNDDVVRAAAVALGHLRVSDAIGDLVALRGHRAPEVRHAAAFALMGHDDRRAVRALVQLTHDPSPMVRDWATFALATQMDSDTRAVREALAERLADDDEETRAEAMVGLATRRDARATEPLLRHLEQDDPPAAYVDAARALASPELLPALLSLRDRGWATTSSHASLLEEAIVACRGRISRLP